MEIGSAGGLVLVIHFSQSQNEWKRKIFDLRKKGQKRGCANKKKKKK